MVACLESEFIEETDLSTVKKIVLYGSKIPNNLVSEVKRYFANATLLSLYGMTEIGAISMCHLDVSTSANSGQLFAGVMAKIIDDEGNRCGPNVIGEIRVKKRKQFLGYLDEPERTAAAYDDEGFFRTGDSGHFDENGSLYFDDRIKNIIRVYYFRVVIIPSEIEEFLLKMPDIVEVSVVGIPITCGSGIPAAVIVRKHNSNLSGREVYEAVAGNIPLLR